MGLLSALVGVLVLSALVVMITGTTNEARAMSLCRASLLANDKLRLGEPIGVETSEQVGINCPPSEIKIKKGDIKDAPGAEDEDSLKFLLAEQLRKCKSKTTFNDQELKPFAAGWFDINKLFCLKCSDIEIDEKVSEKITEINDFILFLDRQKMPGEDKSYFEYLTGRKELTKEEYEEIFKEVEDEENNIRKISNVIDTSEKYGIVYMIEKKGRIWESLGNIGAKRAGIIACGAAIVVPFVGWTAGAVLCGGSIVVGGLGGYAFGSNEDDETTSYAILKNELIEKLGCNKFYQ